MPDPNYCRRHVGSRSHPFVHPCKVCKKLKIFFISTFCRSYPFFRAPDDLTALAELTTVFGTEKLQFAAKRYKRKLTVSHNEEGCDLAALCRQLGNRGEDVPPPLVTDESISILKLLLRLDYCDRISASHALNHPFVKGLANP